MMRDPNTEPIPAPDPATPTVAAPAPMNLAALSMSCLGAEVWSREEAWALAGLMLLMAAMARRGDTDRRAMADILLVVRCRECSETSRIIDHACTNFGFQMFVVSGSIKAMNYDGRQMTWLQHCHVMKY